MGTTEKWPEEIQSDGWLGRMRRGGREEGERDGEFSPYYQPFL